LCELPDLIGRPHAYIKLWKHHAAQPYADRINALAHSRSEPWIGRYGGRISSEWAFAKALQVLEEDAEIYRRTGRWVEASDWIVWQLTGRYVRNACATGYKAIYQDGQFPSVDYLAALNPDFVDFVNEKLAGRIEPLGGRAGSLSPEAATLTGLREGIAVCVGNVDAHVTAPAVGAVEPGQLVAIMGTSTCHVVSAETVTEVPGLCIVAGLWGYEAGQSGVGDIFAWFAERYAAPSYVDEAQRRDISVHDLLAEKAASLPVGAHGLVALDWHSGNRSVLVDHELSGLIVGLTLATRPEEIYLALLEATAFGTRTIVSALRSGGVPVTELIVAGGLASNRFLMQLYSDVTRLPISVAVSTQAPAVGSAMHAAVAAGSFPDIRAAAQRMGRREVAAYLPDEKRASAYDALYDQYVALHDHFGSGELMHSLRRIRREATA
jgi:L-ribulokinase